ncbi:MAG: exodeoxyribonuclease large subunit [Solirubrobacteraceae bacterium]|nr:exodeoxyribonuclease large subunit [Solirubrobacteraceae bacterium]
MADAPAPTPEGIPGSALAGPFPVGRYAEFLRDELRKRAKVQLFGEVWNLRDSRAKVYFELRDAAGAMPCSMWRNDFEALGLEAGVLADGSQVVVAGGPDFYPGSRTSSASFTFAVGDLRVAGEGDLLAQLARLRKQLHAEGLFDPQKRLSRPVLPRTIGVVTGEGGKARDDVLAGLRRRGWEGRLVWAFAPVQDRHAAPRIARALQDLAALGRVGSGGGVDVIVVARGGGSLADLFAFCDETLCRTVAMLPVPVIASVGHHTDRTLIDDVAAVACSTPTHAAESAVPLHCAEARASLGGAAETLSRHAERVVRARDSLSAWAGSLSRYGRRAVVERARELAALSRAPAEHLARHRARLHQQLREMRASGRRSVADGAELAGVHGLVLLRGERRLSLEHARRTTALPASAAQLRRSGPGALTRRRRDLERLELALAAHDPERTLARGYALVEDRDGRLVSGAAAARAAGRLDVRFHDGSVGARVEDEETGPGRGSGIEVDRVGPGRGSGIEEEPRGPVPDRPVRPPDEDPAS